MTTKNILIIDDDLIFNNRLTAAIKDRGHTVYQATNKNSAFDLIECNKNIDSIILDMRLGEESGLEILRIIKSKHSKIKIVMLTGYGTIFSTVEALKLGAHNYLTKPVNADIILASFEDQSTHHSFSVADTPDLAQVEWDYIQRVIQNNDGNISLAAKALGLHRRTLQRKLQKNPPKVK
jgi:two-component system, response regulator RegA